MRPEEPDLAYLWDIREVALEVLSFTTGLSLQGFRSERRTRLAVERDLETIGEAARLISESFKLGHPDFPWHEMIGQRNVLAHAYGTAINLVLIWKVIEEDLPPLIGQIDAIIPRSG